MVELKTIPAPPPMTPLASQLSTEIKTMSFYDALKQAVEGKKIRRISWGTASDYGFMKDDFLTIFTKENFHTWKVSIGDVESNDWAVVETN